MIKNVIFDLGRVLVNFYPLAYLEELGFDENKKNILNNIIFESKEWYEYDRGFYLHNKDIEKKLITDNPKLEKEIKRVLNEDWVKIHTVKEETVEYLKSLKNEGKKIYILSNLSKDSFDFISKLDFFKYVDGGVYSYEIKVCKPDNEIYKTILEKYNLVPEETVFLDDKLENIEAANRFGIHGIQFFSVDDAKKKIKLIG